MNRHVLILGLIMFSCTVLLAQEQEQKKKTIAVYVGGQEEINIKKVFAAKVVSAIIEQGEYVAVERTASFLEEIENEKSYKESGIVSDDKMSKIGQQLGADFVCVVDITDALGKKFVAAKFINAETAQIVRSKDVDGEWSNFDELANKATELAMKLIGKDVMSKYKTVAVAILDHDLKGTYTWEQAKNACENLEEGGYNDWFLPDPKIILYCDNDRDDYYWTSDVDPKSNLAYAVLSWSNYSEHSDGSSKSKFVSVVGWGYRDLSEKHYVRCVRVIK